MHDYMIGITIVLVMMAISGIISWRLKFSISPILIIAGIIAGIFSQQLHISSSISFINFLGHFGVLFLLFYMGLEFSIDRLLKASKAILHSGLIYFAINIPLAFLVSLAAGFLPQEIIIAVGIICISSSAIVAKNLVELHRTANPETELILGLMMFQDIAVAIYLSIISSLVLTVTPSISQMSIKIVLALLFFVGVVYLGKKFSAQIDKLLRIPSDEVFLLIILAILAAMSFAAEQVNISDAIGAMLLGMILAGSEQIKRLEMIILPFRDLFGAAFFFSFGLSINIFNLLPAVWPAITAVIITIAGNLSAGILISKENNLSLRAGFNLGLTISSRGEFSIILANIAKTAGFITPLQPFAALYVLILSILGPVLTRYSRQIFRLYAKMADNKATQPNTKMKIPN
ncbi:MAG: cation:proton antiporter [Bacillota bacterium]|jgi:CPA2 family monovalent cation:H+ antiporter-2